MAVGLTLMSHFDVLAQLPVPVLLIGGAGGDRARCNAAASDLFGGHDRSDDGWADVDPVALEAAGMALPCVRSLGADCDLTAEARLGTGDGLKVVRFTFRECRGDAGESFVVGIGAEIEGARQTEETTSLHVVREIEDLALIGHYVEYPESGRAEWSEGLERLRGLQPGTRPATFAELAETIYPEDVASIAAREADLGWARASIEFRVIRSDATIRNIYRHWIRDIAPDGRIVRVVGIEQDITEFRQVERDLAECRVAADAAAKSKAEFLAHMSHELRTPLNAIKGFSEVMSQELFGSLSERYLDYVKEMHKSAEDLWLRIDHILDLARIEDGQYELGKEHVDLGQIAREVTALMQGRADEKGITVEVRAGGPEHFWAERRALKTIVYNLVDNALKFTRAGGAITVESGVTQSGDAFLRVSDTGIGIPDFHIDRVCDPFFQSRASVEAAGEAGTGLGLAITKSLIDLHEGRIEIVSEVGKGSTFTALMPMRSYSPGWAPLMGIRRA